MKKTEKTEVKKRKSFLTQAFDYDVNQNSPVLQDYDLVKKYDEDGKEVIVFVPSDNEALIASNGKVTDWSLDTMLKAGINPQTIGTPRTGFNSRIEGVDMVNQFAQQADKILTPPTDNNNNKD